MGDSSGTSLRDDHALAQGGVKATPCPQPRSSGLPPTLRRDDPRRVTKRSRRPPASGRLRGGGIARFANPFNRHVVPPSRLSVQRKPGTNFGHVVLGCAPSQSASAEPASRRAATAL